MKDRSKGNPCNRNKVEPAVERVEAGEEFAIRGLHRLEWPHAGENHRRVGKGVDPIHVLEMMIAEHASADRKADQKTAQTKTFGDPLQKGRFR